MARIVGMPGPTAGSAVPVGRARTLAQVYRHFGEVDGAKHLEHVYRKLGCKDRLVAVALARELGLT